MGRAVTVLIDRELLSVFGEHTAGEWLAFAQQATEKLENRETKIEAREHKVDTDEARMRERSEELRRREHELEAREQRAEATSKRVSRASTVRTKIERNERCPCGSGLKYKRSHGPAGRHTQPDMGDACAGHGCLSVRASGRRVEVRVGTVPVASLFDDMYHRTGKRVDVGSGEQMRFRFTLMTVMVGVALLGAGCGSSESTGEEAASSPVDSTTTTTTLAPTTTTLAPTTTTLAPTTTTLAPTTTTAAIGDPCDPANPHPPGLTEYAIMSGGVERTYFVYVPEVYAADESWPVIVGLHGLDWPADAWFNATWKASAPDSGHILVVPQAIDRNWADRSREPDVPFILGALDDAAQRICIDSTRIYASGGSDGADMVTRLACEAGDRFAAVRPYIGMNYPEIFESEGCDQPVPVPMTSYVGALEPYYDLKTDIGAGVVLWAERNGCTGEPVTEEVAAGVTVTRYGDCDQDATVELYTLEDVAHRAAQIECAGNDYDFCLTYSFDTTGIMLEFFGQNSRQP